MAHADPSTSALETLAWRRPYRFVQGARYLLRKGDCCVVHSHPVVEIVYHLAGSGATRLPGRGEVAFVEGSAVIYGAGVRHDQAMEAPGEDWCVHIALPGRKNGRLCGCLYVPAIEEPALLEDFRLLSQSRVQLSPSRQISHNLRATALLVTLLELARSTQREEATRGDRRLGYVLRAERYMRSHFSTIQSMREVADHVGISPDYLRHSFRAVRGRSVVEFLTEARIDRARTLLANYPLGIKQIATMCGYRDEYYFSAVFSRAARMSPGRYRTLHRTFRDG